jgi:hypothetical protein
MLISEKLFIYQRSKYNSETLISIKLSHSLLSCKTPGWKIGLPIYGPLWNNSGFCATVPAIKNGRTLRPSILKSSLRKASYCRKISCTPRSNGECRSCSTHKVSGISPIHPPELPLQLGPGGASIGYIVCSNTLKGNQKCTSGHPK